MEYISECEAEWRKYVALNPKLENDKAGKETFEAGWDACISFIEDHQSDDGRDNTKVG